MGLPPRDFESWDAGKREHRKDGQLARNTEGFGCQADWLSLGLGGSSLVLVGTIPGTVPRERGGFHPTKGAEHEHAEESANTIDILAGLDLEQRAELLLLTLEGLHRISQHSMLSDEDLRLPILQAMDLQQGVQALRRQGKDG